MCVALATRRKLVLALRNNVIYSWGQKSVSKHMQLCTLQYKLAPPAEIIS